MNLKGYIIRNNNIRFLKYSSLFLTKAKNKFICVYIIIILKIKSFFVLVETKEEYKESYKHIISSSLECIRNMSYIKKLHERTISES